MEQARPMLRGIERVLSPRRVFDPARSQRVFRLAAPDFASTLFTSLLARLRSDAPGVSVEWTTAREPTLLGVAEGQVDVAIVPAQLRMPDGVNSEAIGALKWRCFGRQGHPAFSKWGRKSWSHWPHLAVRVGDSLTSPVKLERRIAGWVPHFSAIAPILAGSNLLATLPSIAMAATLHPYRLESREVPFPIAPLPHAMIWSTGRSSHPEMTWLRDRLRPVVKSKFTDLGG